MKKKSQQIRQERIYISIHLPGAVPAPVIPCVYFVGNSAAKGNLHFKTLIKICVFQVGVDENQRCQVLFLFW